MIPEQILAVKRVIDSEDPLFAKITLPKKAQTAHNAARLVVDTSQFDDDLRVDVEQEDRKKRDLKAELKEYERFELEYLVKWVNSDIDSATWEK